MQRRSVERLSFWLLCLALLVVTCTFGLPHDYGRGARIFVAALQSVVIVGLAWTAGVRRMAMGSGLGPQIAASAVLLMWPQATFALMPGYGPPDFSEAAANSTRFAVLLVDVIAIGGGTFLLQHLLTEVGERLWSKLAFGAMASATPAYIIWGTIMLSSYRLAALGTPWHLGIAARGPLQSVVDILQFLGGFLTYLAVALFAVALNAAGLIGRKAGLVLTIFGAFALVCMLARGIDNPPLTLLPSQIFALIGWVAGIPAVPWMAMSVIGLLLVRHSDRSLFNTSASDSAQLSP